MQGLSPLRTVAAAILWMNLPRPLNLPDMGAGAIAPKLLAWLSLAIRTDISVPSRGLGCRTATFRD